MMSAASKRCHIRQRIIDTDDAEILDLSTCLPRRFDEYGLDIVPTHDNLSIVGNHKLAAALCDHLGIVLRAPHVFQPVTLLVRKRFDLC
jgi:hypothetical protein